MRWLALSANHAWTSPTFALGGSAAARECVTSATVSPPASSTLVGAMEKPYRLRMFPIGAAASLEELERDPHPLLARLREHEPVSWLPALDGWLVTGRDLAMQVMRDAETFTVDDPRFSTGQVVGPSMLTLDGDEHRRHRDPFAGPFRLAAVRARFAELVPEETDRLIDAIEARGRADL